MAALLYRLGSFAARRAWQVIVAWVLILGVSIGAFLAFGGAAQQQLRHPGHRLGRGRRRARAGAARQRRR